MLKKHIGWFRERIRRDRLDSTAAHSAYFIIISFLPFCVLMLTIMQQIQLESGPLIAQALTVFPAAVAAYLQGILAQTMPTSGVMSVSILTFLWSASNGMVAMIKGLDTVYEVKEGRNYLLLRVIGVGYLLVFMVVLVVTAVTLVFGQTLYGVILAHSPRFIVTLLVNFKSLLGFFLLVLIFFLMFHAIPRKRVRLLHNLCGAVFSAAGWVIFSFFFSLFVENFSNYSLVYGSLATLIVIMFWLYTCMYIIFLGGEVAVWLERSSIKEDVRRLWHDRPGSP